MYLESNKTFRCHIIHYIRSVHAIQPDTDTVADSFNPILVPIIFLIGGSSGFVIRQRSQPTTSCFIIKPTTPSTVGRVDLALIAMHTSIVVIRLTFASKLHPGIQVWMTFHFKLQNKITIRLFCRHKAIRFFIHSLADHTSILYTIGSLTVQLLEASKILTIKQLLPSVVRLAGTTQQSQRQSC